MKIDHMQAIDNPLKVAAFYCFTAISDEMIFFLLDELSLQADRNNLGGTVLLASEGVNGTICGSSEAVLFFLEILSEALQKHPFDVKFSWTDKPAFRHFKVRKKAEIVTMGVEGINPNQTVGLYVEPSDWNDYLNDPETLVIDTRNKYEVGIGSFDGALNPKTDSFRQFPKWVDNDLGDLVKEKDPKRIAMFCTGGIRCEKATSYLMSKGFKGIHHLRGGILRYLQEVPEEESLWNGECFVFDQRVALNQHLLPGEHQLCYACGMPLDLESRNSLHYIRGVQCHYCEDLFSDLDRIRFAERQKQFDKREQSHQNLSRKST